MYKSIQKGMFIVVVELILLSQVLFSVPFTCAKSTTAERSASVVSISEGVPAGLSSEEWHQIINELGPSYEQAYLKASNVDAGDSFGCSAAIDGDTLVVGAELEDSDGTGEENNNVYNNVGAAYVFVREGSTWTQQAYLKASNAELGDYFGSSVAIDGDTIVVGAKLEDGDGSGEENNDAVSAGAAYVFVREGSTWTQQAYLKAFNAEGGDYFGSSVAIDGDTITVGAYGEDSNGTSEENNAADTAGAAYIFVREGTTWTQQAYLKASNAGADDHFGWSVAIDGDTIVVGASREDSDGSGEENNDAYHAGAAYVFVREGSTWTQQAYLKASNVDANDIFGYSVAIDRDTIVVGAYLENSDGSGEANNDAIHAGAAYVFTWDGTFWTQQAYLKASNAESEDNFGAAVAISGDRIVVGANHEDSDGSSQSDNSAENAGAAYVFIREGSTWTQQAYLKASNADEDDEFGRPVAMMEETIVVGVSGEDSDGTGEENNDAENAGAAYVFTVPFSLYLPLIME